MNNVQALTRLTEIATGFMASQALSAGCSLGLFEALADGAKSVEALAVRIDVPKETCSRLVSALLALDLLERRDALIANSQVSSFLTSNAKPSLEGVSWWTQGIWPQMWAHLPASIKENKPAWSNAFGATASETFAAVLKDPARLQRFSAFFNTYSMIVGARIADVVDFRSYKKIADIGGGMGGIAIQVCRAHRHMTGVVTDLPPVCKLAERNIAENGVADRVSAQPGDLFNGPFSDADVMSLSWVLHGLSDESCKGILNKLFGALPSGGAILVSESVVPDNGSATLFQALLSLHMLVACEAGARERTGPELKSLLESVGFVDVKVIKLDAPRDLVIGIKR